MSLRSLKSQVWDLNALSCSSNATTGPCCKPPYKSSISIYMPKPTSTSCWDAPKSTPLHESSHLQGINHSQQSQDT